MNDTHTLEAIGFLVDEKPYCVWEWDLKRRNIDFISELSPGYFRFMAEVFDQHLHKEGENQIKAALSLRTAYSHALEAFISLVGAAIQAPDCVPGWLLKYHQTDLENVAKKLNSGNGLATKLNLETVDWKSFSELVASRVTFDSEEKRRWVVNGFSKAWTRFSHDILDENAYTEYNNIKHGFRVRLGGFTLAFGEERAPGTSPTPNQIQSLGGSKYGTSFLTPEKLGASKNHFRLRSASRNWAPENYISRLCLIEMSMNNVIAFLKALLGADPAGLKFSWPSDPDAFNTPWSSNVGVANFNMNAIIDPASLTFFTDDEIRAVYQTK